MHSFKPDLSDWIKRLWAFLSQKENEEMLEYFECRPPTASRCRGQRFSSRNTATPFTASPLSDSALCCCFTQKCPSLTQCSGLSSPYAWSMSLSQEELLKHSLTTLLALNFNLTVTETLPEDHVFMNTFDAHWLMFQYITCVQLGSISVIGRSSVWHNTWGNWLRASLYFYCPFTSLSKVSLGKQAFPIWLLSIEKKATCFKLRIRPGISM